jgi:PAS domain S-box-containing protein
MLWERSAEDLGKEAHLSGESSETFSDARLRAFVSAVFDAYYDWDIDTGRMEMSGQIDSLLGLEPGSLPRTFLGWVDRLHPEDRDAALADNLRAAEEGGVYEGEYRLRRGDGSYVLVNDRGYLLADQSGRPTHMVGAIRDVSQQRAAERALREAADLYGALFDQPHNPAYHIAAHGGFLDANAAGLRFLRKTQAELLNDNVAALWGGGAMNAVRSALLLGRPSVMERLELRIGDALKSMTLTLVPCTFEGQRTCFALGTDITEHDALRRALEDANTALRVILDQRNRDRTLLEEAIVTNVETMVAPLLEQLRRHLARTPHATYVDAALRALRELVHPLARSADRLAGPDACLTRREREIANLIAAGKTTSEIAEALFIAPTTVTFHRQNLRRKLGLGTHGPSLASYLSRPSTRASEPEAPGAPPSEAGGAPGASPVVTDERG